MRRRRLLMLALSASVFVLLNAGTAWAGKPKPPHIVVGADHETSAVFSYTNAIRERVFIPVPGVDQDGDGVFDRVSIDIIRPAETNQGMKVPAIIDPSPYYTSLGAATSRSSSTPPRPATSTSSRSSTTTTSCRAATP